MTGDEVDLCDENERLLAGLQKIHWEVNRTDTTDNYKVEATYFLARKLLQGVTIAAPGPQPGGEEK